jgi:hypothetical protein
MANVTMALRRSIMRSGPFLLTHAATSRYQ